MKHIHEEAQAALMKAKEEMKQYADYHRGNPPEYRVSDKVWLETENLRLKRPSKKLSEKRIGPYSIVEVKSSNAIQLKLPRAMKIHPVVNISHVCPYKPS
jgi:glycosylphosphatidylinositol phospholipase D